MSSEDNLSTYIFVSFGKLKPGEVVLVVEERSSDVGVSPPIKRIPEGDCHATWCHRSLDRVWDLFHTPAANVTQVVLVASCTSMPPHPPHAVSPDCEWSARGKGREGRMQLRPLGRITSTEVRPSFLSFMFQPPVTNNAANTLHYSLNC